MSVRYCPECDTGVVPGQVACTRCGYDFIKGSNPQDWRSSDQTSRRANLVAITAGVGLLAGAISVFVLTREPPPPLAEPCVDALDSLRVSVQSGSESAAVPTCPDTPPGSVSCWAPLGLTLSKMPAASGERYRLRPSPTGFDIECRSDLDKDGEEALYRTTESVEPVRITGAEVR
jgi:hypothetical protein